MTWVAGIDPGAKGAIALYNADLRMLGPVWDMPTWYQTIGRSKRLRIDVPALARIMQECRDMNVELAVLESVGGLPKQSAPSAFTFGWSCGVVYMGLVQARIAIDPVRPAVWKKIMRCGKELPDIANRAAELFPGRDDEWKTPRGAIRDGRAEAAMMALFAGQYALGRTEPGAEERMLER